MSEQFEYQDVSSDCEEGEIPKVRYNYEGGEFTIVEADRYELIEFMDYCNIARRTYFVDYFCRATSRGVVSNDEESERTIKGVESRRIVNEENPLVFLNDNTRVTFYMYNSDGSTTNTGVLPPSEGGVFMPGTLVIRRVYAAVYNRRTRSYIESPRECKRYKLKFYKEEVLVGEEISPLRPDVEFFCQGTEGCPPNTCQVDCGDIYCCYNSEGIAIGSVLK